VESRPELVRRLREMRRICQNEQHEHDLLAQAEAGLVEQLDATGRELVGAWLQQRDQQEQTRAKADPFLRKHSKKNCASRRSSAPRKATSS
jgi:hypothetical protein